MSEALAQLATMSRSARVFDLFVARQVEQERELEMQRERCSRITTTLDQH